MGGSVRFLPLGVKGRGDAIELAALDRRGIRTYAADEDELASILVREPVDVVIASRPGPAAVAMGALRSHPPVVRIFWGHDIHSRRLASQRVVRGDGDGLAARVTALMEQASPDLLRSMVQVFAEALMGAQADAICGAEFGARSPDRVNSSNGYRTRPWDTRAGTIDLQVPKLRSGTYFPEWLLTRRSRAEAALVTVVAASYVLGVSTRRVEKLVAALGITALGVDMLKEVNRETTKCDSPPGRRQLRHGYV